MGQIVSDPVKRSDWRISPLPAEHGRLPVELSFTPVQFARLKQGRKPRQSGDKWFIFFEEPWLYLHRALTGACMFQVRIEPDGDRYRVREALVDRDCSKDKGAEEELSHWLCEQLLWQAGRDGEAREHSEKLTQIWRAAHAPDDAPPIARPVDSESAQDARERQRGNPRTIPDYSSPAEEQRRERSAEDERREALLRYNESTFGESHSFASVFLRVGIFAAIAAALGFFLPGRAARLIAYVLLLLVVVWDARKGVAAKRDSFTSLRYPWRRW